MKSNRTHTPPPEPIEDLGDGTFYYNFNIVEKSITPGEGETYLNFDYDQVRCPFPVDKKVIQQELEDQGYAHTVKLPTT